MTTQTQHSSFVHSAGGQAVLTIVAILVVIAVAWKYVF